MSSNHFNGTFQSSFLQRAWNLTQLTLKNNSLTGPIPSSPCTNSPFVRLFDFSFNDHSGRIPSGLGRCSQLEIFRAGFNSLSGFIPHDIYGATALEEISIPSNNLSGSINNAGIANLTKLTNVEFYNNRLSGKLPVSIGKLSKLKHLLLHTNSFTGSLPASLMNCTNLIRLNLRTNYFQENITNLNLSSLQQLTMLDLGNNDFTGKIPVSIHSCKFLKTIRISRNRLEGQIPNEVIQLKALSFLSLSYNKLTNVTGAIKILMHCKFLEVVLLGKNFQQESMPTDASMVGFTGFENLRYLDLSLCQLTGELPIWLSKLKKLQTLALASNRITGSIPSWLSTLPRLNNLDLSYNLLSGEFPKELCALPAFFSREMAPDDINSLLSPIFFLKNNTAGPFSCLSNEILLGHNNLSGNIPTEIGNLKLLRVLNLGYNSFSGNIPDQLSELTNLEYLVLSSNQLSGELPASLASLHFLSFLSVANNKLHGAIPLGTQLQSFDASAYEGNPGLCGVPLQKECGRPTIGNKDKDTHEVKKDIGVTVPWFHVIVGLGFITGFWGVCGPLALSHSWRVAYFGFLNNLKDRLYVRLTLSLARLQRSTL
ncbi:tyrosine-sulfated glycopeptide receptor 1-like [Juglans regia]|nr:tyrosine-sulfated glycopeptide receptor 1-like [Juglans regia]